MDKGSNRTCVIAGFMIIWAMLLSPAAALDITAPEGPNRGFPVLRDLDGRTLAHADFVQWLENGVLHVKLTYDFGGQRRIEEQAGFRQMPRFHQETWSWTELSAGTVLRRFRVDFASGVANAEKLQEQGPQRWSEKIDIAPGRSFAGIGFVFAVRHLRERLVAGEPVELRAVAFTPQPRDVLVEISYGGRDRMRMSDRTLQGDRFTIRPRVPWLARIFIDVPDTRIWLTEPPAPAFLRMEGPLMEPDDPIIRVDLLSGGESGPAQPLSAGSGAMGSKERR